MTPMLARKVSFAWLLVALVLSSALLLLAKVAVLDAPPSNAVLITVAPTSPVGARGTPTGVGQVAATSLPATLSSNSNRELSSPSPLTASPSANALTAVPIASPTAETVMVYVTGAVGKPGVYPLPAGSRIADAVTLAGGLLPEADTARVNLAEKVTDEEHILVPKVGETPAAIAVLPTRTTGRATPASGAAGASPTRHSSPPAATTENAGPSLKVNINTATAAQLEALPGIGPSLSERIVAFRDSHGAFATPEDIMLVPGIKEGLFGKIRDFITVGP